MRNWEFRQRHLAHGAWHQFLLALAAAQVAYAIDEALVAQLVAEGFSIDPRGSGLQPSRRLVWVTPERAAALGARRVELRLDAELLATPASR